MSSTRAEWSLDVTFFKALSDPTRLALIEELSGCCGAITVTEVSDCCTVDMSVVSRHLKTLQQADVVRAEKQGREVRYTLNSEAVVSKLRGMADSIESVCRTTTSNRTCCPDN